MGGRSASALAPLPRARQELGHFPPTPRKTPGISERPPPRRTSPARRQGGPARRRLPPEESQSILPRCPRNEPSSNSAWGAGGQERLQESDSGRDIIYPRRVNLQGGVCNLQRQGQQGLSPRTRAGSLTATTPRPPEPDGRDLAPARVCGKSEKTAPSPGVRGATHPAPPPPRRTPGPPAAAARS